MTDRYAVYFSPSADSELGRFGETILCRTANSRRNKNASSSFENRDQWLRLTEKPAHYGFHATLKAPFELANGYNVEELIEAVSKFATNQTCIAIPSLYPRSIDGFMALTLDNKIEPLSRFALDCVETFEQFRRPLSEADLRRRKLHNLSNNQELLLKQYGYPYVADEFNFHLTLSGKLNEHDENYEAWVINEYDKHITDTPVLDHISIFTQATRQSPFEELAQFSLL